MIANSSVLQNEDGRYERKFQISGLSAIELELLVRNHPSFFYKAFPRRFVNNIYFDSPNFDNFTDNIEGSPVREKARVRWYGDSFPHIHSPVLEVKRKFGLLGFKEQTLLQSFEISSSSPVQSVLDAVKESFAGISSVTRPVLLNRYGRDYFISADKKFRITIDQQLTYCFIGSFKGIWRFIEPESDIIIMELKYHPSLDKEAAVVTNGFPFRVTKSSKYAKGIYSTLGM